ncbi:UDP-N-acetylmuramoyl-tripeptide--D-alanyl-D-alanine ligase [Bacterioplanoides pacificum]|uniref:UDP-N-acetylmuramoyl-tripeptide--D-alanyl-D-alanine ligase n=1 Tax=Bacterioplanoides pacificum TaxID=1171596 RepID=A0ABV7VV93_9GAMM
MLNTLALSQLSELTSAHWLTSEVDFHCVGVSTDSRSIKPGELYVPLKGERFNGHDFLPQVRDAGAAAALVDEIPDDEVLAGLSGLPLLQVSDCLAALGDIARWQRRQFAGPVVAVTGSAGKTSVKQIMANVLSQQYNTWMTQGNLNNHIGVPLTLLALQPEHQAAVIELGASGLSEIAYTAQFVEPQVGIITNASAAHLDGFGSLEGIVQTKGELIDFIQPGGTAVLNADDAFFPVWLARAQTRKLNIMTFGLSANADVRAGQIHTDLQGCHFSLQTAEGVHEVFLPLLGEHNVRNALAVVAAALAVNMPVGNIIDGLQTAEAFAGRLRWCDGAVGQRILDDSYNASPASVRAAIDVLAAAENSWLILGDMAELGKEADTIHHDIGRYAREQGIQHLVATGTKTKNSVAAFGDQGIWFSQRDELVRYLQQQTRADDVLLVKGSRSAGMDKVVKALQSVVPIGEEEN